MEYSYFKGILIFSFALDTVQGMENKTVNE